MGSIADDVDALDRALGIVPVTDDIDLRIRILRHLHAVKNFLGQACAIDRAADAGDFGIAHAAISDGIGPDDLGTADHDASRLAVVRRLDESATAVAGVILGEIFQHHVLGALQAEIAEAGFAIVEIIADEIAGAAVETQGLVIIGSNREVTTSDVFRGGVLAVPAGIQHGRVFIPNAAGTFAPGIFGIPKRIVGLAFRSVHGAGIFANAEGRVAVVGAQSGEASAMGIPSEPDIFHVSDVLVGKDLVAAFVEEDAGIVAIINGDVAHIVDAFVPDIGFLGVAFVVGGGDDHDDAEFIRGGDLDRARGDVHGADEIAVGFLDQLEVVFVHPIDRSTDAGPFHGGARGIAFEIKRMAVDL